MLTVHVREKHYADRGGRRHLALRDLRLSAEDGEFVCLVGPSGCGKSTLLNIIGGLDATAQASVDLDAGAAAEDVGFMFQEPRLMPWLTVRQNVCLVCDGRPGAEQRALELLRAMELGEVVDAFPGALSGGMQRRVALARAFVIEPRLLLMDEPFVSLDAPTAARLREMLITLWQRRRATVLFVTHDLREALALADRVCFLSASPGRIVLEHRIDLPRPRDPQSVEVGRRYEELLSRHPGLLAGLGGDNQDAA
ncbi:MAG: ABC transporter ATP-binding protein [Rhodocyclaceae bacterium]|nr:ABC transporter ATP-binding protein [Rhodocyclaceae bacterium]